MNNGEVAHLIHQIEAEHKVALRSMVSFAECTARHRFITAYMGRMWSLKAELSRKVGEKQALTMMCRVMLESKVAQ